MTKTTELSEGARILAFSFFGLGTPGKTTLSVGHRKGTPTESGQAALDELVAAGIATHSRERDGTDVYTQARDCRPIYEDYLRREPTEEWKRWEWLRDVPQ